MQVDRQPSPWPCVAMLAGLLLFCLMAPRYWHNSAPPEVATIGGVADSASAHSSLSDEADFSGGPLDLVGATTQLGGPPTIEELIAARTAAAQFGSRTDPWPILDSTISGRHTCRGQGEFPFQCERGPHGRDHPARRDLDEPVIRR